jgi:DNA invertase Pin-like site-specific DNA recombinase
MVVPFRRGRSKLHGNGGLIPAVGYLRRSTDKQEASIPEQRRAIQQYADEHGYNIIRWYTDDAISGDETEKRHEFQRMIADAKERQDFEAILCWDQDRFGRFSPHEASYWTWPLAQAGIQLVTVAKGPIDWNDFVQWLTYSVNQHGKHEFLRDLSRNVTRGQLEAALNGSWLGSIPYAYILEGPRKHRRLVLGDVAHIQIVQRIFREYVEERRAMMNIANRLNDEGVPSPGGRVKGWRWDKVKTILENPAYVGDYAGCRYSYGKYHTINTRQETAVKSDGRCRRPEEEWIVRRDHHEAIIDRPTFDKAQALLARGKKGRSNRYTPETNPYVLSGLLRCGRCGEPLWGTENRAHRYYECGQHKYQRQGQDPTACACEGTTVREDKVLQSIADCLDREFMSLDGDDGGQNGLAWRAERKELKPGDLPKAFAKIKALVAPPEETYVNRQQAEKQAKALAEQIDKARRNLVLLDPEYIPAAQDKLRQMQKDMQQLETELRKKPPTEQDVNAEATEVLRALYWLAIYFRLVAHPNDPDDPELVGTGWFLVGDFRPAIRPFLARIAGITVYTRIEGRGTRRRHLFERGEIALDRVGVNPRKVNPHVAG